MDEDVPTLQGAENGIHQVSVAEHELRGARELASEEAVATIRRLEALLQVALQGGKLRGCPNLTPDWSSRAPSTGHPGTTSAYLGWRLRGDGSAPLGAATLAGGGEGSPALVLNSAGAVCLARRTVDSDDHRRVLEEPAQASDFRAGDLIAFVELLEEMLPMHVEKAATARVPFEQARELVNIVNQAIADAEEAGLLPDR